MLSFDVFAGNISGDLLNGGSSTYDTEMSFSNISFLVLVVKGGRRGNVTVPTLDIPVPVTFLWLIHA